MMRGERPGSRGPTFFKSDGRLTTSRTPAAELAVDESSTRPRVPWVGFKCGEDRAAIPAHGEPGGDPVPKFRSPSIGCGAAVGICENSPGIRGCRTAEGTGEARRCTSKADT